MLDEDFVLPEHRSCIYFDDRPARLLEQLSGFVPPTAHKWIDQFPERDGPRLAGSLPDSVDSG